MPILPIVKLNMEGGGAVTVISCPLTMAYGTSFKLCSAASLLVWFYIVT